jgi:hypothetical protein
VGEFFADLLSHRSALRKAKMVWIRAVAARNPGAPFDQLPIMRTASIPGRRRIKRKQGRGLAVPDTAPKLPLGGDDQALMKRIRMGLDLRPLAPLSVGR